METSQKKECIRHQFIEKLYQLTPATPGKWGVMSVQQMVEHLIDYIKVANGRVSLPVVTPADKIERAQAFLLTEIPFKENTGNVLMPDTPAPIQYESYVEAVNALKQEIDYFFEVFENNPTLTTSNPFFGELNIDLNIRLLYKHMLHHLTQFGAY